MAEKTEIEFTYVGDLIGHNGQVTSIVAGIAPGKNSKDTPLLVSGSRDKSLMIWQIKPEVGTGAEKEDKKQKLYGYPFKSLTGHNHFISDIALSSDSVYAISSSWDKTLRLWDLRYAKCLRQMTGHNSEVMTVAFSPDNRQILSGGCDNDIKLWNTLGDCKFTTDKENHTDWVSCIRFSPSSKNPYFASVGWDGRLKVWNLSTFGIKCSFKAHEGNVNQLTISPNGAHIATGGRDHLVNVWDYTNMSSPYQSYNAGGIVNTLAFNPLLQWLAVGSENSIRIWDLKSESKKYQVELIPEFYGDAKVKRKGKPPACSSLAWGPDGKTLFAGYNDGVIRVYQYPEDEEGGQA